MDSNPSVREWTQRLASLERSGLSVREWCQQQGVSLNQYYYWRRRIPRLGCPVESGSPQWLSVEVSEPTPTPPTSSGMTLRIAGAVIELEREFDAAMLRAVVSALGGQPCSA